MATTAISATDVGQTPDDAESNAVRATIARAEPRSLRTYTPSLAVIERSEGCYHFTPEGKKLADFTSGVLVANLGHNPTGWWRRVMEYMGHADAPPKGQFFPAAPLSAYNAITTVESRACRRLLENLRSHPGAARLEQVLWAASGSEGVIKALSAALAQHPARQIMLATRGGFHGKKGLALAVTGSEGDRDRDPRVKFISFPRDECVSVQARTAPLDLAPYQDELDRIWATLGESICCLITEPYLGGGGSYHPQKEYLQLLQDFCRKHEIVFILDEVQSNFGRTGPMYAFTQYGVEPDMIILGKGMGNGIPVNAVVGRAELFEPLAFGESSDTWSAHPLGCAAVMATLDEFENGSVLLHARELSRVFEEGLLRLTELPAVRVIRGEGTVWGIQCCSVGDHSSHEIACEIVLACYRGSPQGLAIHLLGPLAGDVIRVAPPLVMEVAEARVYLDAMYEIVQALGDLAISGSLAIKPIDSVVS